MGERLDEAYYYIGRIEMSRDRYARLSKHLARWVLHENLETPKPRRRNCWLIPHSQSDIRAFFDEQRRVSGNAEQLFLLEADALSD